MSSTFISCYNEKKELEHFKVPYEVYIYIRQLENEIINRNGAVQRLYDFRFGENYGERGQILHRYVGPFEDRVDAKVFIQHYKEEYTKPGFITKSSIIPLCEVL